MNIDYVLSSCALIGIIGASIAVSCVGTSTQVGSNDSGVGGTGGTPWDEGWDGAHTGLGGVGGVPTTDHGGTGPGGTRNGGCAGGCDGGGWWVTGGFGGTPPSGGAGGFAMGGYAGVGGFAGTNGTGGDVPYYPDCVGCLDYYCATEMRACALAAACKTYLSCVRDCNGLPCDTDCANPCESSSEPSCRFIDCHDAHCTAECGVR